MSNYKIKITETYCVMLRGGYSQSIVGKKLRYGTKQKAYIRRLRQWFLIWPSSKDLL